MSIMVYELATGAGVSRRRSRCHPNRARDPRGRTDKYKEQAVKTLERIVLIDDDTMDNTYHTLVLRKAAVAREIIAFTDPAQALDYLKSAPAVDLIFLDLNMPRMTGFEFATALGKLPAARQAPVIMLTASPSDEDRARAGQHPEIRDYLSKPLTQKGVRQMLERLFAEA